ncbi:MAG: hypothetical protein ACRDKV_00130 [Solirubrobacterales bacterium]
MRTPERTARLAAVIAGAAAVAAIAGCGGDSPVSEQEFRSEVSRVCRDIEQQLDQIQETTPITAGQAETQAEAAVELSEQALGNLRQIDPPEELEPAFDRYLSQRERAIGFIEEAREAAADKDSDAYARAKRQLAAGQPLRRELALRLELRRCSRPSRV